MVEKNTLPQTMQVEIMVANPEATQAEGFLQWVRDHAPVAFPEYMMDEVVASWNTRTYRSTLEADMGGKHAAMTQAANQLLDLYHRDTVPPPPDTLRWVWQQVRTRAARFAEAASYMAEGRYNAAYGLIFHMPDERALMPREMDERTHMLAYIGVLKGAAHDERDAYHLDQTEIGTLQELVENNYDRPTRWAANLLCAAYGLCTPPHTGGGQEERAMQPRPSHARALADAPGLTLQPNPASTWCAVNYALPANALEGTLVVRDMGGRMVTQVQANGAQGQWIWDTRTVAPGVYSVELRNAGRTLCAGRVVVQP